MFLLNQNEQIQTKSERQTGKLSRAHSLQLAEMAKIGHRVIVFQIIEGNKWALLYEKLPLFTAGSLFLKQEVVRLKIFITGVSGFLGNQLAMSLSRFYTVVGMYHKHVPLAGSNIEMYSCPMEQLEQLTLLLHKVNPDVIIHTAAMSDMQSCYDQFDRACLVNATASHEMAKWCAQHAKQFVFISTEHVFDGDRGHYLEAEVLNAKSHYGKTKALAEKLIQEVLPACAIIRLATMIGLPVAKHQNNFTVSMIRRMQNQQAVFLYEDEFRNFVDIFDVIELIKQVVERQAIGIFHCGGSHVLSRFSLGQRIAGVFGLDNHLLVRTSINSHPLAATRPHNTSLSIEATCHRLAWCPRDLNETLAELKATFCP